MWAVFQLSFLKCVVFVSSFCVNTLSLSSPLTAALHVVDLIVNFILCTVETWEPLNYPFLLPQTLAAGMQGITKKQQEQARAEYKTNTSRTSSVKAVQTFCVPRFFFSHIC